MDFVILYDTHTLDHIYTYLTLAEYNNMRCVSKMTRTLADHQLHWALVKSEPNVLNSDDALDVLNHTLNSGVKGLLYRVVPKVQPVSVFRMMVVGDQATKLLSAAFAAKPHGSNYTVIGYPGDVYQMIISICDCQFNGDCSSEITFHCFVQGVSDLDYKDNLLFRCHTRPRETKQPKGNNERDSKPSKNKAKHKNEYTTEGRLGSREMIVNLYTGTRAKSIVTAIDINRYVRSTASSAYRLGDGILGLNRGRHSYTPVSKVAPSSYFDSLGWVFSQLIYEKLEGHKQKTNRMAELNTAISDLMAAIGQIRLR